METTIRRSITKTNGSILIGILRLVSLLCVYNDADHHTRGRPYVYPTTVIIRCYIVRIWHRIPSNNALHYYFAIGTPHNKKIMKSCGLESLPDRRTFDRRFKVIPVQDMIRTMGNRFVTENLTDPSIVSADSSMIHAAKMRVWHKMHRIQGVLPHTGIDTDAGWGRSKSKGWVYGYKLHMSCSTRTLPVPLSAEFTAANIPDSRVYHSLIEGLSYNTVQYVAADLGYDDSVLYQYSKNVLGAQLVCPIRRKSHTKGKDRLNLVRLYSSPLGRRIYGNRSISVEPLFEIIKNAFSLYMMPVCGYDNCRIWTLMCVFVYQLAVYWNCVIMNSDRPRCVKRMLGN